MFLIPLVAFLLWIGWTVLAYLKLRNPHAAVVLSGAVLLVSIVTVILGAVSGAGKTAALLVGPGVILAAIRLRQGVRALPKKRPGS
ncbi:hypothetical protein ACFWZ2_42230 [Streptomyces sp. NPDC059002]|uniref:hypothetical protein n=1 Tax=Streptomyces sp. NPDC059002 TaxID=3346690 RepID=UPI00367DECCA